MYALFHYFVLVKGEKFSNAQGLLLNQCLDIIPGSTWVSIWVPGIKYGSPAR